MDSRPIFQGEEKTNEGDWVVRYGLVSKGPDKYVLEYVILMREDDGEITPRVSDEIIVHKFQESEDQISMVLGILLSKVEKKLWKNRGFIYINPKIESNIREKWPK